MIHDGEGLMSQSFPNEIINACMDKELERAGIYQDMVLRYLPFSPSISRLMSELSKESEARVERLVELGKTVESQGDLSATPWLNIPSRLHEKGHFFVIDALMAVNILEKTWKIECENQVFYEWLKERNATPCLDRLLTSFIEQAESQMCILQEAKTEAFLLGQWRHNPGMLKKIL